MKCKQEPRYEDRKIFSEHLIAIHVKKKLIMSKPVYLGMAILNLSKALMYQFHYGDIKPKYGENANLLFTDTDSLMYLIRTDDVYKGISPDVRDMFDTSEYPANHPSSIPTGLNKKVLGMFKDEVKGRQIDEFVGLRAKLNTYKTLDENLDLLKFTRVANRMQIHVYHVYTIAKMVNTVYLLEVCSKYGIYHLCYRCKLVFASYLPA